MQQILEFHLDVRATPHTLRHTHASHLVAAGVPTVHV